MHHIQAFLLVQWSERYHAAFSGDVIVLKLNPVQGFAGELLDSQKHNHPFAASSTTCENR